MESRQNFDGLIAVIKRDCPTCQLIAPMLAEIARLDGRLRVYCQDDPGFPAELDAVRDDTDLETSYRLGIEIVPTLPPGFDFVKSIPEADLVGQQPRFRIAELTPQ